MNFQSYVSRMSYRGQPPPFIPSYPDRRTTVWRGHSKEAFIRGMGSSGPWFCTATRIPSYFRFLSETRKAPEAASRWLEGLLNTIATQEQFPERRPLILEADGFENEVRQLIYFSNRIIFGVEQAAKAGAVFRIYHGARQKLAVARVDYAGCLPQKRLGPV